MSDSENDDVLTEVSPIERRKPPKDPAVVAERMKAMRDRKANLAKEKKATAVPPVPELRRNEPEPIKKKQKKQVIVFQSDSDSDDAPTIVIRKSKSKPRPRSPSPEPEPEPYYEEEEPEPEPPRVIFRRIR